MSPALRCLLRSLGLLGRTKRTTLLLFIILMLAAHFVASAILLGEARRRGPPSEALVALATAWPWIGLAARLLFLWLAIRRFHDQDRPGWLVLFPWGILMLLWLFPLPAPLGLMVWLVTLLGFIVSLFLPPTVGPNRYGPDPRGWRSPKHYAEERRLGRAQ